MKKFIAFILIIALIAAGVYFVPKLIHKCDDCGEFFIGAGHEPNVIKEILNEEEQIICKSCAEDQHALSILAGSDVDEFKRSIFD